MSYNDQDSQHLLIWINIQRKLIGERHRVYSFDQLKTSRIIPSLLNNINSHFFADLVNQQFDYKQYLLKIEKYLNQVEELKFKRGQRQQLLDSQFISEMVKLILFLVMRHEVKQEFVNRILQLEDDTQIYLMHQIKRVESWLQNKMEIKEVLQTIESLEEQNEILHHKLKEISAKNAQASELKSQLQLQNSKLSETHRLNNQEKAHFMQEFGITHPREYLAIYKDLLFERNEMIASQSSCENQAAKLAEENREMQQKIAEDALIIDHLNEEIGKYRDICSQLRKSAASSNDLSRFDKENTEKQCSTTLESVRMIKSVGQEGESVLLWQDANYKEIEQNQPINQLMHSYQDDLVAKLQEMYSRIGALNSQISSMKTENEMIACSNSRKEEAMREAFEEHQEFSLKYRLTLH